MSEPITFAVLDSVLTQLGFQITKVPKSHVAYRHSASDTALYFPLHRPKDLVPAISVVGIRKVLVDRGVVEAARLDEMLQASAA